MEKPIRETLVTVDGEHIIELSLRPLATDGSGAFIAEVVILLDGSIFREKTISSYSQGTCMTYALFYIGNNIRDISRNRGIEIDLYGSTFDEDTPLPKGQRDAWGE